MRILLPENEPFEMNNLPDMVDDLRFCILDYSNLDAVDYYFTPLFFLETFSGSAADLQIGPFRITIPLDWAILIGDKHQGDLELILLSSLNDRDFSAFSFNPIKGFMPSFFEIELVNVFTDLKWFTPKLKFGTILAVPLRDGFDPPCIFIVKDVAKLPDVLDITKMF